MKLFNPKKFLYDFWRNSFFSKCEEKTVGDLSEYDILLVTVVFFHEDYEYGNRLAISCLKKVELSDLKSSDAWNLLFWRLIVNLVRMASNFVRKKYALHFPIQNLVLSLDTCKDSLQDSMNFYKSLKKNLEIIWENEGHTSSA